jgi:hypothetical protein
MKTILVELGSHRANSNFDALALEGSQTARWRRCGE